MSKVPAGWEKKVLKDILKTGVKNGYSPNAVDYETGYWVLSLAALGDNGINANGIKPVILTDYVLNSRLIAGDFLVSRSNTPEKVGRSIKFRGEVENCSYPDLMMKFRVDKNLAIEDFIEHVLKGPVVRQYYKSCAAGSSSSMVKINKGIVEKTPLLFPPLPEQTKIAQILSTWDKAIATTEQLIGNSQQQKKSLMQSLLTGKKRLPGFEGEWSKALLGDIAYITTGSSNRQDSTLNGNYAFFDRSEDIRTSNIYLFDCEAVIVPGEGQDFVPKYFHGRFDLHQRTYAIMNINGCDAKFIFFAVSYFRGYLLSQAVGSTVKSLRLPMFKKMPMILPPLPEQQKIAAVLTAADNEIELLQKKLAFLKQEKAALMQQLLTGKRRVKVETA